MVALRIAPLPERCHRTESPSLVDVESYRDWSSFPTTDDQSRIESILEKFVRPDSDILHVGIGNSLLACRFSPTVRSIVGITVSPGEAEHGRSVRLPNYQPGLWNKYRFRAERSPAGFDAIVDNNPTSFSCCLWHLSEMIAWYKAALRPEGAIFTDRMGLGWVLDSAEALPACSFSFDQWRLLGACVGLEAVDIDGYVYVLTAAAGRHRANLLRRRALVPRMIRTAKDILRSALRRAPR